MDFVNVVLLMISLAHLARARFPHGENPWVFNVMDFGAAGNGLTDDSKAFLNAWRETCGAPAASATLVVPKGPTFLVGPTSFMGPCKPSYINLQVTGTIIAPDNPESWQNIDASLWLAFHQVNGLTVNGQGTLDGRGVRWWQQSCRLAPGRGCTSLAPTMVKFINCNSLHLNQLNIVNSPQSHILIQTSQWVNVTGIRITSPGDSPNTDGIHIQSSQHVLIQSSTISSGDDCISIGDHTSDIQIRVIACGPGHGISIGSLGRGGTLVQVENIHIRHCNFYGTTNGARIKTWQGGRGYARMISFQHLNFTNVQNPVIIDQYYCDHVLNGCRNKENGVQISDVTYANLYGTSSSQNAVSLNCSQSVGCTGIHFDTVDVWSPGRNDAGAVCINAHGDSKGMLHPSVPCLTK